ncbi:MAG: TonB family protein [Opitutaceae bacterium]|nr:TonB family protein [Opitutaceae bacterium]
MSVSTTSQTHSASPYVASLVLHGAVVLAIALSAMVFQQAQLHAPAVFELVAGEGVNYAATEAPAPSPDVTFERPDVPIIDTPLPPPPPPPDEPEPRSVVQPVRAEVTPPDPVITPKPVEPPVKPAAKPKQSTTSWEAFRQQNKTRTRAQSAEAGRPKPAAIPKINVRGVAGGTGGAEGAGGNVLSRSADQDLLGGYLALLQQKLKEAHEKPSGLGDHLSVTISFKLSATGAMSHVRVTRSSGNAEFDQSALAAFRAVRSIGPRPDGKTDERTAVFKMSDE